MEPYTLQMTINDILVGTKPVDGYIPITLETNRGGVLCKYFHITGDNKAVIFVGGIEGGFASPAKNLYPRLCDALSLHRISSLQIQFRDPTDLFESSLDIIAGIAFLERFGIKEIALVGHSIGGTAVIHAATAAPEIISSVIVLAAQPVGVEIVTELHDIPILLIHGTEDAILPVHSSTYIHDLATSKKELLLFQGAGHYLDEAADGVYDNVEKWLLTSLK